MEEIISVVEMHSHTSITSSNLSKHCRFKALTKEVINETLARGQSKIISNGTQLSQTIILHSFCDLTHAEPYKPDKIKLCQSTINMYGNAEF